MCHMGSCIQCISVFYALPVVDMDANNIFQMFFGGGAGHDFNYTPGGFDGGFGGGRRQPRGGFPGGGGFHFQF